MSRPRLSSLAIIALLSHVVAAAEGADDDSRPYGLTQRIPWTSSQVKGRPEPPLPYRPRRIFPKIGFEHPTVLTNAPGTSRLFVAEQRGKIYSIPDDPDCEQADLFLDVKELVDGLNEGVEKAKQFNLTAVYGMTFHPKFAENRYCYVCYVAAGGGQKGQHPHGSRVVRVTVDDSDPPRARPDSEVEVITWLQGGHNGGCLKFGLDDMLYVSTGDGGFAFPPDGLNSGQDVSNLLSAVLRIDVDHPSPGQGYSIPADNPLVSIEGARGEIWAYGLRNPWKMSIDRATGELWVGDVGWELWELVFRVKPGDNYGWSIVEGRQTVHAERQRGPTPIVPPTVEIPHTDGASVTGGYVYRGRKFPELQGTYLFGDWETRRIWGVKVEEQGVGPREELVEPMVRIVDFGERNDGELLLLDYDNGSIHELERNPVDDSQHRFPRKLSETGLFASVERHQPAAGVLPYSINAEQWADYATSERWLALPGETSIHLHDRAERIEGSMFSRSIDFPLDAVLSKTLSLEMNQGDASSRRRIETQLLHFNGYDWRGYSYRWNDEQTDAELVEAQGATISLEVVDAEVPGGKRTQAWRIPSRMECIRCHNPWAEYALAFNVPQINRDHDYGGIVDNQIRALRHIGVLAEALPELDRGNPFLKESVSRSPELMPRLADPFDATADIDRRSRSYIHVNCAHCHRFNGGGSAHIHMPFDVPLNKTEALSTRPTQGTFGIHDAKILVPGDPYRSVLYFRMAKTGPGHMPRIGAQYLDRRGLRLIHDWIQQLPQNIELQMKMEQLLALDEPTAEARERDDAGRDRWRIARKIAEKDGRSSPVDEDLEAAVKQAEREAAARVAQRSKQREKLSAELMAEPVGGMLLARACLERTLPQSIRDVVLTTAAAQQDLAIRDLFEQFLPEEQRVKRLGEAIDPAELLAMTGDLQRGRELFFSDRNVQCRNCHKVADQGKELGPELTAIGKKLDRVKLLESILEPSKNIDPKFQAWLIETESGKTFSGLLVRRDEKEVVLRDTQHKEHTFAVGEIEGMFPQQKSLMPDLLLRDMTAQQVADLLAWLESLK